MARRTTRRGLALVSTVVLAVAAVVGTTPTAGATTKGTVSGYTPTERCGASWSAAAVLDMDLKNSDKVSFEGREYTDLMVDPAGAPVNGYSNGGFLTEVSDVFGDPGWMEMQHWADVPGNGPTTKAYWRFPIGTDKDLNDVTATVQLPEGSRFTGAESTDTWLNKVASAQTEQNHWNRYAWQEAPITPVVNGTTVTFSLGSIPAGKGIGLQLATVIDAARVTDGSAIGKVTLRARTGDGVDGCPKADSGVTTSPEKPCSVDWSADARYLVTGTTSGMGDITRTKVVSPELGGQGKFGVDGWGGPDPAANTGLLYGRYVLTTDQPIENGTWVIHVDHAITASEKSFTLHTPIPDGLQWRVDKHYPGTFTMGTGTWDESAHTMTYTNIKGAAKAGAIVDFSGSVPLGTWTPGTTWTNSMTLTADYPPTAGNPLCTPRTALDLDKTVTDASGDRRAQAGETLTYTFHLTNRGNVPLADPKVVEGAFNGTGKLSDVTCADATIAPGKAVDCTATYVVTEADAKGGVAISNEATATATATTETITSNLSRAYIDVPCPCKNETGSATGGNGSSTGSLGSGSLGSDDGSSGSSHSSAGSLPLGSIATIGLGSLAPALGSAALPLFGSLALPLLGSLGLGGSHDGPGSVTSGSGSVPGSNNTGDGTGSNSGNGPGSSTGSIPGSSVGSLPGSSTGSAPASSGSAPGSLPLTLGSLGIPLLGSLALPALGSSVLPGSSTGSAPVSSGSGSVPGSSLPSGSGSTPGTGSGTGSVPMGSLIGSVPLDPGSVAAPLGSLGSLGSSASGAATIGSAALGSLGVAGLAWAVNTGAITLPPLPTTLAGMLPAGSSIPGMTTTTTTPPPAPGPQVNNGRG